MLFIIFYYEPSLYYIQLTILFHKKSKQHKCKAYTDISIYVIYLSRPKTSKV